MRRGDDVGHRQQRRIERRFDGKHIERRAGQVSRTKRVGQRGFVHQLAPRGVDQARAALHLSEQRWR